MHKIEYYEYKIIKILNFLAVIASIILISTISIESINDEPFTSYNIYTKIQIYVCFYFIFDVTLSLILTKNKFKISGEYVFVLIMSTPYLFFINYFNINLSSESLYIIHLLPLFRGALALIFLVFMVVRHNTTAIFISYLIFLLSVIYFLTLMFYVVEHNVNSSIKTYSDALWWAAMTVTTLGSVIQPITVAGKIITTAMALVGLTILPIFTAYLTTLISRIAHDDFVKSQNLKNSIHGPNADAAPE